MTQSVKCYLFDSPDYYFNNRTADYNWRIRQTDRFDFLACKVLDQDAQYDIILSVNCSLDKIAPYDVLPENFGSPLVKGKALDILQDLCPEAFQTFDAEVQGHDGSVYDYKILNLLEEVGPINFKKTDCRYFDDGDVAGIEKLVMQPHAMNSCHIGRLKDMKPIILVSETVQKAFKKAKIKAIQFREIEMA